MSCAETAAPTLWVMNRAVQLVPSAPATWIQLQVDELAKPAVIELGCVDVDGVAGPPKKSYTLPSEHGADGWSEVLSLPICHEFEALFEMPEEDEDPAAS